MKKDKSYMHKDPKSKEGTSNKKGAENIRPLSFSF